MQLKSYTIFIIVVESFRRRLVIVCRQKPGIQVLCVSNDSANNDFRKVYARVCVCVCLLTLFARLFIYVTENLSKRISPIECFI